MDVEPGEGRNARTAGADFERAFIDWARGHEASHHGVVAVEQDELIGMTWLAVLSRIPSVRATRRASGDLQSVYVLPEHRGGGVGAQLIAHALSHAQELGLERVTVHSSQRAIAVYLRAGFAISEQLLQYRVPQRR